MRFLMERERPFWFFGGLTRLCRSVLVAIFNLHFQPSRGGEGMNYQRHLHEPASRAPHYSLSYRCKTGVWCLGASLLREAYFAPLLPGTPSCSLCYRRGMHRSPFSPLELPLQMHPVRRTMKISSLLTGPTQLCLTGHSPTSTLLKSFW